MTMSDVDRIRQQIKGLQEQLSRLEPLATLSVRQFAKAAGIIPTTAHRIKHDGPDHLSLTNARKLLPFFSECPCCNRALAAREKEGQA